MPVERSERSTFDVVGALTIEAERADTPDLRALARDLGTCRSEGAPPKGAAHLSVRFVDDLPVRSLYLLDARRVGYDDDGVYLLEPATGRVVGRVSQSTGWGGGGIECLRGLRRVPLLSGAIDLAALSHGWVPLHAAAWTTKDDVTVIASGWAESGKTGALLAACEDGATPLGDDRVLLFRDGRDVVGLGRPVELKPWHIAQLRLPSLRARRGRRPLARTIHTLDMTLGRPLSKRSRTARKALRRVRAAGSVELDIVQLGAAPDGRARGTPQLLLLLETHTRDSIVAEPADPELVPARLAAHVAAELAPVLRMQRAIDYVSPGTGWRDVQRAPDTALRTLEDAVQGIPAWLVRHPYPCSLADLHAVISRLVAEASS